MTTWRDHARPIIARVLEATKGQPDKAIRKALRDAYPWGERRWWPYKVWLDEIHRQRRTGKYKHYLPRRPFWFRCKKTIDMFDNDLERSRRRKHA